LDMSPLSLCWHNKALLPTNSLKGPVSQLANSCNTITMRLAEDIGYRTHIEQSYQVAPRYAVTHRRRLMTAQHEQHLW
jgi:hypothetical protein